MDYLCLPHRKQSRSCGDCADKGALSHSKGPLLHARGPLYPAGAPAAVGEVLIVGWVEAWAWPWRAERQRLGRPWVVTRGHLERLTQL